jgi:hypothetical protein
VALLVAAGACDSPVGPHDVRCGGTNTLEPVAGSVSEPPALVGEGVCIQLGEAGDFIVVLAVTTPGAPEVRHDIDILGDGFTPGSENMVADLQPAAAPSAARVSGRPSRPELTDLPLRQRERSELSPLLLRPRGHGSTALPARAALAPPDVGSFVEIGTATTCSGERSVAVGRVVAVTQSSVVVADTSAGPETFDDAALQAFGDFFDGGVAPLLTTTFGAPSDIDGNGRVILFFTPASNRLAPTGSTGIVGGYFWGGDLFPVVTDSLAGLGGCANSNEAEILYLSVPSASTRASQLFTRATIGHEFQHLLNASRRLRVNGADELEEPWLNEGLSLLSEELLFFAQSGLQPGMNIGRDELVEADAIATFNDFAYNLVGRLNVFLLSPHFHSLMGSDGIETRGAAWSFLRYALDRSDAPEAQTLFTLANSTGTGRETLHGAGIVDDLDWMAEWAVSHVTDDLVTDVPESFRQRSWNLPQIMRDLRPDSRYPLDIVPVVPGAGLRFSLSPGSAGYGAIRVEAGAHARLKVVPGDPSVAIRAFLVRLR